MMDTALLAKWSASTMNWNSTPYGRRSSRCQEYAMFVVPKLNLDAFPDVTNVQVQLNPEQWSIGSRAGCSNRGLWRCYSPGGGNDGKVKQLGEVVVGIVLKRFGANTKNTIDDVKARLEIVQKSMSKDVTIQPFYDQSDLINEAVRTVGKALLEAFVLIIIILFLFLMSTK